MINRAADEHGSIGPMRVNLTFKNNVRVRDGVRYMWAQISLHQEYGSPATGLWDQLEISAWVPHHDGTTVEELREAALAKVQAAAAAFAKTPREKFQLISEIGG